MVRDQSRRLADSERLPSEQALLEKIIDVYQSRQSSDPQLAARFSADAVQWLADLSSIYSARAQAAESDAAVEEYYALVRRLMERMREIEATAKVIPSIRSALAVHRSGTLEEFAGIAWRKNDLSISAEICPSEAWLTG